MKRPFSLVLMFALLGAVSCVGRSEAADDPGDGGEPDAAAQEEPGAMTVPDAGPSGFGGSGSRNPPPTGCAVIECPADLVCVQGACVPFGGRGGIGGGGAGGVGGNIDIAGAGGR